MKNLIEQRRVVIKYVRDRERNPVGVVLVYKANNGIIKLGYSKCDRFDRFNQKTGLYIAFKRAFPLDELAEEDFAFMPTAVVQVARETVKKARRYFSDENQEKRVVQWDKEQTKHLQERLISLQCHSIG
jgi:hypothetical protein